jgi:cytochrome c-type biogenesis protein CcmH
MRVVLARSLAALALAGLLLAQGLVASDSRAAPTDAAIEARVKSLALELRCLVCQNQTIADSQADLAVDLRTRIREQIAAGASDEDVRRYMVERYGEFVLYRPSLHASTALLWFGPALLVVLGLVALAASLRRRSQAAAGDDPDDSLADGSTDHRVEESHLEASNRSGRA